MGRRPTVVTKAEVASREAKARGITSWDTGEEERRKTN
jgi:hypothetical protein